jgi:DNA-binding NtrC family response regulator
MQRRRRILVADDNDANRNTLRHLVETEYLEVETAGNGEEALEALIGNNFSVLITDLRMPGLTGMQIIEEVQKRRIPTTVIVMTGHGSIDEAVQAMRLGAYDFLTKPIDAGPLRLTVQRALRDRELRDEVLSLREQLRDRHSFFGILSKNRRMHQVFELISNLAHTTSTVLIEGETGTGKEAAAKAIHLCSAIRGGPLVAINCAAVPETLLESELFGHEKGAFTSAVAQRRGRFELADGGTLFLDEVGDIPAAMQAKLLRVLQERRFERVGGTESIEVDVRVIAATNRSLQRLVKRGTFREDLYYRLNVVKIDLPPLRDRAEDIPLLAAHFAEKYTTPGQPPRQVAPQAMDLLLHYRWPGNIRELENAIERAGLTAQEGVIRPQDLPPELTAPGKQRQAFAIDLHRPLPDLLQEVTADVEQQYLSRALKKTHGNIGRCAKLCGLSRRSISAKIAEYRINKAVFKEA